MTYKKTYCLIDLKLMHRIPSYGTMAFDYAYKDLSKDVEQSERVTKVTWEPNAEYSHDGYLFDLTIETE